MAVGVAAAIPDNRKLSKKEHDLFRSIVKFYETKQYKKGLKAADSILRKYPSHGETQAMKGLILNCMERKEEAYELVKQGLRNDVRSHVCWHVFGLLHRSDRNHGEAIKCYLNALRIDTSNMQILKDLANLQVQMRDLDGFVETRRKILSENCKLKVHWIGFVLANHLSGDLGMALSVIDSFLGTLEKRERGFEEGELVLYKAMLLEQAGRKEEALSWLESQKSFVMDGLAWRTRRAHLLLASEQFEKALEAYRALLAENSENYEYHLGWQCALLRRDSSNSAAMFAQPQASLPSSAAGDLDEAASQQLLAAYGELARAEPHSLVCEKVPLTFLEGEAFKTRVDAYMRRHLARGLPALGSELAALFRTEDPENGRRIQAKDAYDLRKNKRFQIVQLLVDEYIETLAMTGAFPSPTTSVAPCQNGSHPPSSSPSPSTSQAFDVTTTLLWAKYLKVQLLESAGEIPEALKLLEECLAACGEDTGAKLDFLQRRARLLKKGGRVTDAAVVMDEARQLDLSDRYLNNQTTKYLLRAGQVEAAQNVIALFAKHEGDPQVYLTDMQCMWYELEWAHATFSEATKPSGGGRALIAKALKRYVAVEKHFADFVEDQFDFHNYCVRKMTLRAYVDVLRLEDGLLAHPYYLAAARGMLDCYMAVLEMPKEEEGVEGKDAYAGMTAAEKKKEKAKARKAAKKLEAEAAEKAAAEKATRVANAGGAGGGKEGEEEGKGKSTTNKKGGDGGKGVVDEDPEGMKLIEREPLTEMKRVVAYLTRHAGKVVETHMLAYDVACKRGKALLALQALIRAHALRPMHPDVFRRTVHFWTGMGESGGEGGKQEWIASLHPTSAAVIDAEKQRLLGEKKNLGSYVTEYVEKARAWSSLPHVLAAARGVALAKTEPGATEVAIGLIREELQKGQCRGLTVKGLRQVVEVVGKELDAGSATVAEMKKLCHQYFPDALEFSC
ncbi:tetratricopeptide repeat-containing protein [Nannochloropsis gaditana]|uniref:Tetratricopeptide repeat-containing protein n=1 Tax=Nannochloropsis gaditana TaxID=72520 RepID=W7TVH9_9STRA|nr:tetratricopeptide repeat-containing protein [Nannochloropsis gaditana]